MANSPHQQRHWLPAANHVSALTSPTESLPGLFFFFSSSSSSFPLFRCFCSLAMRRKPRLVHRSQRCCRTVEMQRWATRAAGQRETGSSDQWRCTSGASPSPPASAWRGIFRTAGGPSLSTVCVCSCVAVRRCSTLTAAERAGLKPTRRRKSYGR